jgi:hypothetical protein
MRRRLNESDIDRIVNRVLSEQVAPTKELSDCCKSAGITVPMACTAGDPGKCIEALLEMASKDPMGMGMKAITAMNCIKDKKLSPVQY